MCGQLDVASFAGGGEVRHLVPATLDLESQSKGGSEADAPEWSFLTTPPLQLVLNGTRAIGERTTAMGTIAEAGGPYLAIFQADKRAWPKVPLQRPSAELSFTSGQFEGWIVIADRRTAQPVCEGTLSVSNSDTVNFPPGDAQTSSLRARSAVFDDFRTRFTEQSAERVRAMSAGQLRLKW